MSFNFRKDLGSNDSELSFTKLTVPIGTNLNNAGASLAPNIGSLAFNTTDDTLYYGNSTGWICVGCTGFTGMQGEKGDQGDQGVQGIQGIQGIDGVQGIQGRQGDQGIQGIQGKMGPTGMGFTGQQGLQGPTGMGFTGQQGLQGPTGMGFTGQQGLQGPTGMGVTGQQGDRGDTGIQGLPGFTGPQGFSNLNLPLLTSVGNVALWGNATGTALMESHSTLGSNTNLGSNSMLGSNTNIGNNSNIGNNVNIGDGVTIPAGMNFEGTGTGGITSVVFGDVPTAGGASLSGQTLALQPADATNPGGVSTFHQNFAGIKNMLNGASFGNMDAGNHNNVLNNFNTQSSLAEGSAGKIHISGPWPGTQDFDWRAMMMGNNIANFKFYYLGPGIYNTNDSALMQFNAGSFPLMPVNFVPGETSNAPIVVIPILVMNNNNIVQGALRINTADGSGTIGAGIEGLSVFTHIDNNSRSGLPYPIYFMA